METPAVASKISLEASKERLAIAFRQLQDVVDGKLKAGKQEKPIATEQLDGLLQENTRLKKQLEQLSTEYAALKEASMTAFTHLDQSISQLEILIDGDTNPSCP